MGTAHHDLPFGTTSTQTKEIFMNKHLVVAAAFASLFSHAVFAAGEGGESDTWSRLEPKPYTRSTQSLVVTVTDDRSVAPTRYDGGDTWSQLEPQSYTRSAQALTAATSGTLTGEHPGVVSARYDGGDTWSELQPQAYGRSKLSLTDPVGALGTAALR